MNRNQRRFGRFPKRNYFSERGKVFKKNETDFDETLAKNQRNIVNFDQTNKRNRCCFTPNYQDFGHITINCEVPEDIPHESISKIKYSVDHIQSEIAPETIEHIESEIAPETIEHIESEIAPATIDHLIESKNMLIPEFDVKCVQYQPEVKDGPPKKSTFETWDESRWQNINNVDDIPKYLNQDRKESENIEIPEKDLQNVHISDAPRVKVIAEKYSKYKKNNIEVRKLEEKVVCVEYDVYDLSICNIVKPVQVMRAFFTIKPVCTETVAKLPSDIKTKYNVEDDDFKKLTNKELEIIDGKIKQNKPYLDDLKKILKRNKVINDKKNKSSLDLQSLYQMAKQEQYILDSHISKANILSDAELQEMKDLILKRCISSVHGMLRTKMGRETDTADTENRDIHAISNSIIAELIKQELC